MCEECGCTLPEETSNTYSVEINKQVSAVNDAIAQQISQYLSEKEVFCINVMGSPGSGKTTFIEGIAKFLDTREIAVIQGDLESDVDKQRMHKINIETFQINTHSGCHLNASMVNRALMDLNLSGRKYLFIENVGNLVCPAGIRLGQRMNAVISSTTEGSDKPKKYPVIFMNAHLVVISKSDLAEAVEFDEQTYLSDIKNINSKAKIIKTSAKEVESFKEAAHYIQHVRAHAFGHSHDH
jgi:hydrogenase nickel incorporation protein HypB